MDQAVEDERDVDVRAEVELAVLEDHQAGRLRGVVLLRDVQPVVAPHAGVDALAGPMSLGERAARRAGLGDGVRAEGVRLAPGHAGGKAGFVFLGSTHGYIIRD